LEHFLRNAGLDIGKLNKLRAQNQKEVTGALQKIRNEAALLAASDKTACLRGIANRKTALEQLRTLRPVAAPTYIELDTPIFILQLPQYDPFMDFRTEIGPGKSNWAMFNLKANSGTGKTEFVFYFLWRNESDYYAVVNIESSLILSGYCQIKADTGILSGDEAYLSMTAELSPIEYWIQPPDQPTFQLSQQQQVTSLDGVNESEVERLVRPYIEAVQRKKGHLTVAQVERESETGKSLSSAPVLRREKLTKRLLLTLPDGVYVISNLYPNGRSAFAEKLCPQADGAGREAAWQRAVSTGAGHRLCQIVTNQEDFDSISEPRPGLGP
jgi:hypothetical protein